jgi:hypothetical protein
MQRHSFALGNRVGPTVVMSAKHEPVERWVAAEVRRVFENLLIPVRDRRIERFGCPHDRGPARQADLVIPFREGQTDQPKY